jgi:hypothetical protein
MIMKQFFFLFAMLASITANAGVTITPLSVDYPNKKVTFRVAWTGTVANDHVWVWVDLCPVVGASPGTIAKAIISEATGSGVVAGTLNGRGFYVNVNGATVTATLSNATGKFNWCAYGSDFPPNAVETSGTYTLKGSPPFIVTTTSGTVEVNAKNFSGGTITALTDATGCPGVLCGKNGETPGLLNCCVTGTTNCSGTCTTTGTSTTNDGTCTGACNTAYVQLRNQCGQVINSTYGTYTNTGCTTPNYTTNDGACTGACKTAYMQLRDQCGGVIDAEYGTYEEASCGGCEMVYDMNCRDNVRRYYGCADTVCCPAICQPRAEGAGANIWYAHWNYADQWCECSYCF